MEREEYGQQLGLFGEPRLETLDQIPTLFGRLVYLASLLDRNIGRYNHPSLSQGLGEAEADRILRECHARSFADWLCLKLERQEADLSLYLAGLAIDVRTVLRTWTCLEPYRDLVPPGALKAERRLYMADLEAVLELLRNEHGVPCLDSED